MTFVRITAPLALLLAAGCAAPAKTLYDGPERDPAETVVLAASKSYVFSVNNRRTGFGRDASAELVILPGTQRLIVHLEEDLGGRYGYVGVPVTFCAVAGQRYTVYPVTDPIARLWQPAIRDGAGGDVALKPCAAAAPPPVARPEPPPASPPAEAPAATPAQPAAAAPAPAPAAPPPAASPAPTPSAAPAAQPGTIAAGNPAVLRGPGRTRSLDDAPTVPGLAPGSTVTLKVLLKKDNGAWWYVKGAGASGWVREDQLEPVEP